MSVIFQLTCLFKTVLQRVSICMCLECHSAPAKTKSDIICFKLCFVSI